MILSDRDIKAALASGELIIEPALTPEQCQPAWVDLTLGSAFRVFKHADMPVLDPKAPTEHTEEVNMAGRESFILHPGEFVLGAVNEYVKLPAHIAGAVDGRSSLGRLGIVVHVTSTFVDPGWGGKLVLEITNVGKMPVKLYPGMRICKLVFFKLSSPAEVPYDKKKDAKYSNQQQIIQSRIDQEFKK